MLILSSKVIIGQWVFNSIVNVEIDSSYENLTDTCVITIPRNLSYQGKSLIADKDSIFNKGDKVSVYLGYGYDNKALEFSGYLIRIESGSPTKIYCEDAAYKLKETQPFNLTYPMLKIQELLSNIIPASTQYKSIDIELGKARFSKMTASQILKFLKDKFGIKSWFRNDQLYVGLNYWQELQATYSFSFQKNIINDNLQFVRSEDTKVRVKAISILKNNSKIEVTAGDSEGTERTLHFYNVTDSNQLKALADKELINFKFDGFTGSFTTFGCSVKHGDIIQLSDLHYPEKNGSYIVKQVKTNFGTGGYRKEIFLAEKV